MAQDLTVGKPGKVIVAFAVPLIVGNFFQQLYNTADTLIVGRTIGTDALAAVGCTSSIFALLMWFASGFTSGCMLILAQRYGAKDAGGLRKSLATSILLGALISAVISLAGTPVARLMLRLMQTPENIIDAATVYLQWILAGMLIQVGFNLVSGLCRALGDSKTPLFFLAVGCTVNIGMDLLFILVFRMGVAGAAAATLLSQLMATVGCYLWTRKKFPVIKLTLSDFKISLKDCVVHGKLGIPIGFQNAIIALGIIAMQIALNRLGDDAVAAYTAAGKVEAFATLPLQSVGVAVSNYTAQNYGAGNFTRIRKGVWRAFIIDLAGAFAMLLINLTLGRQLMEFFVGDEPKVVEMGYTYLLILGVCYGFVATIFIFRSALQGMGKGMITTLAGVAELLMRFFGAMVLGSYFGFAGVCAATPLAWVGACVPLAIGSIISFRKLKRMEKETKIHPL